jgi:hypothetical protein
MFGIIIAFIAVVALFSVGVRWGTVAIGKLVGRAVHDRHRNAEYITTTGAVPEQWQTPYLEQIDAVEADHELTAEACERRIAFLEAKRRRHAIKRLDGLLRYFARAPVFAEDEARQMLLGHLEAAKATWLAHSQ